LQDNETHKWVRTIADKSNCKIDLVKDKKANDELKVIKTIYLSGLTKQEKRTA